MKKIYTYFLLLICLARQATAQKIDIKTAVEQFGKKVYTLQQNEIVNNTSIEYWIEGNIVNFYFGKYTNFDNKDPEYTVFTADGKTLKGTAQENNLPNADKPMTREFGNGSYEDETSDKNYIPLNEKSYTINLQNYQPRYSLNYKGKSLGPYTLPPYGITSKKTNSFFYITPTSTNTTTAFGYNQFCMDGKVIYDSKDSTFMLGGNIECSANGKYGAATLTVNNAEGNGAIWLFTTNRKRLSAATFGNAYHIMNSGQLLAQSKDNSDNTVKYTTETGTEILMPEKTTNRTDFFSSNDVSKWASITSDALYFSDGKAFSLNDNSNNNTVNGMMPKKITIDNKDFLVWLAVYNNDVYLCKKDIN